MSNTPNSNAMNSALSTTNTVNLIKEFLNLSEEDVKLVNFLKEEFSTNYKFFSYGSIVYIQKEDENLINDLPNQDVDNDTTISEFPHVTELLENYEKIYSKGLLPQSPSSQINQILHNIQRWL